LGIPTFPYPDTAARMFNYMWSYSENLRSLYETPDFTETSGDDAPNRALVSEIIDHVRHTGRNLLTEYESKKVLAAYGIPTVTTELGATEDEAVQKADAIGYPVVIKLNSETITHKTDVGGVKLNLQNAEHVRRAYREIEQGVIQHASADQFQGVTIQPMEKLEGYEIIIGSSIDPQFGPVLLFGTGGQLVEVFKDRALGLPPLTTTLARRMMEGTRIYTALKGVRGRRPVDLAALERMMVRFSQLVVEQPWIREIDINPLLASSDRLIALDARVVLHDPTTAEEKLPQPAIRPYPMQYMQPWTMHNGQEVLIRPIRPEDETLLINFHKGLSERTVFLRYLKQLNLEERIAHERLSRMCFIDYDREIALVAECPNGQTGAREIIAAARMSKVHSTDRADFAIVVSDQYQGQGLGRELIQRLVQIAREMNIRHLSGNVLADNVEMLRLTEQLGFTLHPVEAEPVIRAEMML
jgi:acetyltransferase